MLRKLGQLSGQALATLPFGAEIGLLVGVGLTVAGTVMQWQLPRRRMSFEERMKDGKLTEQQAARMIRLHAIIAPLVTIAGAGLMIWGFLGHLG